MTLFHAMNLENITPALNLDSLRNIDYFTDNPIHIPYQVSQRISRTPPRKIEILHHNPKQEIQSIFSIL